MLISVDFWNPCMDLLWILGPGPSHPHGNILLLRSKVRLRKDADDEDVNLYSPRRVEPIRFVAKLHDAYFSVATTLSERHKACYRTSYRGVTQSIQPDSTQLNHPFKGMIYLFWV